MKRNVFQHFVQGWGLPLVALLCLSYGELGGHCKPALVTPQLGVERQ